MSEYDDDFQDKETIINEDINLHVVNFRENNDIVKSNTIHQPANNINDESFSFIQNNDEIVNDLQSKENQSSNVNSKSNLIRLNHTLNKDIEIQIDKDNAPTANQLRIQPQLENEPELQVQVQNQEQVQYQPIPIEVSPFGIIPTLPSYIKQIDNEFVKIIELRRNNLDPNETYTPYPLSVAIITLIINIFLPGIGTLIASIFLSNASFRIQYFLKGICELMTCLFLIGWIFALYDGATFIIASVRGRSVEEYILDSY